MATEIDLGITADVVRGMTPLSVKFSAAPSIIDIISYFWEFGDGYSSRAKEPTHVYNDPGIFNVRLTIKDAAGFEYTDVENNLITTIRLAIRAYQKPSGDIPLKVKFTFTEYLPEDYLLLSQTWDFGDGSDTSTEESPVHVYQTRGRYTATITGEFQKN